MTTPNQLLNELRDEIKQLNRELEDSRTPEYKKLFISNRLRLVAERLEGLLKQAREAVK